VRSTETELEHASKEAVGLAQYFGEDPAKMPFEKLAGTLTSFCKEFTRCIEQNKAQCVAAERRKKAEKKTSDGAKEKQKLVDAKAKQKMVEELKRRQSSS
jgi:formin 2